MYQISFLGQKFQLNFNEITLGVKDLILEKNEDIRENDLNV